MLLMHRLKLNSIKRKLKLSVTQKYSSFLCSASFKVITTNTCVYIVVLARRDIIIPKKDDEKVLIKLDKTVTIKVYCLRLKVNYLEVA